MLILKQNAANTVPTPPAGKGTIFLDDSDTLSVKKSDGNVENFPTVGSSNTQVVFTDGTALAGDSDFTWNKNTNVLTVNGNIAAGNVKTDNLLYANGSPWDLQQPGGSNTQVQFNDADSFGGSANYTFNKTTNNLTVTGNIIVNTGSHYGDGGGLSNIAGANVTGEVAYAATANSVAGGNVSGAVATATNAGTVTTAAQGNITSVGTLTGLTMGGDIIPSADSTYDLGNSTNRFKDLWLSGSSLKIGAATISANATSLVLTNPQGGNVVLTGSGNSNNSSIVNGNSSVVVAANGNVTTSVAGNANILTVTGTGANISGTLNATGNANVGNIGSGAGIFTANVTAGNVYANSGTVGASLLTGTLTTAAQPNVTSVGTLSSLTVTGTATAGHLSGEAGNISNVQGANVSGTVSSATTAGTVTTAAQPNITSVGTLTSLGVNGTVTAVAFTANTGVFTGNGSGLSAIAGANVTGTVGSATTAGTVTTAAQPNITSVGTLTSLSVTGNISSGNIDGGNLVKGNFVQGTLVTAAQPNITSVGTLSSVAVTANGTFGNVYANSGTIGAGTLKGEGGNISNIQGANVSGTVATATNAGTVTTAAQPNITSVGTLTSLSVTGNISGANLTGNHYGNGAALSSLTGGNVTGQVANALVAGTVYTAAQPNITSVGTLTSLNVSGNANVGNIGTAALVATGTGSFGANLNMNTNYINNLGTPSLSSDAATKQYVDDLVSTGLYYHAAVNAATTTTLAVATGGTMTYTAPNGAGNGIGAYLSTTGTFNLIDTVNVQTAGTRILVKNEANATWNGVYVYTNTTAITRSTDTDSYGPGSGDLSENDYFYVSGGNVNIGSAYICNTAGTITFGTTNINFAQFSSSQVYSNGVGLNLSGTQFSLANTAVTAASYGNGDRVASFTVDAQGRLTAASNTVIAANAANLTGTTLATSIVTSSLTTVGTLGTLSVTGNANVGNIGATQGVFTNVSGNGSALSSLTGGNVTGQVGNALVSGTVYTAAQPNITSVGTLTTLGVSGTITAANITANTGVFTGNGNGLSSLQGANVTGTVGSATTAGTVTTAAQPNITSVGTLTSLAVTGNVTVGNIIGPHANGNSNVNIPTANGNVNISAVGNITMVVTGTGANIAGTLNATGNANVNNLGTAQVLASANVTAPQLISNIATGTAPLVVTSTTTVANLAAATATTAGTVTTAAQPNITSVGTLSSLAVTGNVTAGNANVTGQLISTVSTGTAPLVVTSTTQVANLSVATAGSATTAGTVTTAAQPNITSVGTLTSLGVSGTITAPNFTANTGVFTGNANGLSSLQGANVTGTLNSTTLGNSTLYVGTTAIALNRGSASQSLTGITSIDGYAATVSTAAQPNITSVGTLTSLSVSGNITAPSHIANTGYLIGSVNGAVSAAGTAQGNATVIASMINVVSTVASGAGVALPSATAGMRITIVNTSANALLVYPASGGTINSLALNGSFSQPAGGRLDFVATSTTQWYTLNATYA